MRLSQVFAFVFAAGAALSPLTGCDPGAPSTPEDQPEPKPEPSRIVDISAGLADVVFDNDLPALGAAIVDVDGVRALGVSGLRSKEVGALPVEAGDAWHLGSNTKAMTAVLAARLVDRGVIDWNTTVSEVWPSADPAWSSVRLEALLQHRGGTTGDIFADYPDAWRALANQESHAGRIAFVEMLVANPPDEAVGGFVYSNAGYMMAGAMLEAIANEPWQSLMQEEIFAPLAMASCGFGAPTGEALWGHAGPNGRPVAPGLAADNPPALGPAGTVHCSLEDYGRFIALFLDDSSTYLSAESLQRLITPEEDYALGWIVTSQPWSPGPVVTHVGSNTLWFANTWVSPSLGRGYVAVTNSGQTGAFEATNTAIIGLLERDLAEE